MTPGHSGKVSESLSQIERAISELWEPDDSGRAKARAHTLNLVALSGGSAQFLEVVDHIGSTLAARTFLVEVDPRAEPWALDGEVGAVCRYEAGQKGEEVCAERIELKFGAMVAKRARSIIESLSESRLPGVLLLGPGAHGAAVDALSPGCTRVVLDSANHGVSRSQRIAELSPGHIEDLAFSRGRRWREMIARFFDDPALTPAAKDVRSLRIEHVACAREEGMGAEAELLLGWLGGRLGWQAKPGAVTHDQHRVQVALHQRERSDKPLGWIESVALSARLGDGEIVGRVSRDSDGQHLSWSLQTPDGNKHERRFAIPHRSESELVLRAVTSAEGSELTREALRFAAAWRG
jgi:glucose-6-phosphate dehydrogenase assembly protein OpcA